jgi:lysophospholipase L1-like esterase
MSDSADLEIGLAGQAANRGFKLWIDGQPATATTQAGPGASGSTHLLRVTFSGRAVRHVRIRTNAGITGLKIGPTDTVWASTRPLYAKRAYFLGDSFTSGAGSTYQQDGYVYVLSDMLGWEPLSGGELGTGYGTNGGGSGGRDTFANRALTDLSALSVKPDVIVVYGGTNDSNTGLSAAAATTYANLATSCPGVPVYVFGVQYPSGATDATRDTKDATIQAAALAASNVKAFTSVKSWFTGTGRVGATTGSGNSDVYTSSDGLHPAPLGHEAIGRRMFGAIVSASSPTY